MKQKSGEIKVVYGAVVLIFLSFLAAPLFFILKNAFLGQEGFSLEFFQEIIAGKDFFEMMTNSLSVSILSAALSTILAFLIAYTLQYTNLHRGVKKVIRGITVMPMLLPTITYGFAIIYSFGKQGLMTKLFGKQLFEIYGKNGLVLGFVIYTLPVAFTLIYNTMLYIDKKFSVVSKIMGDSVIKNFKNTVLVPMLGTLGAAFVQSFFLCFTDFGIPASVGGEYKVIASSLYGEMLGSLPNFHTGSVIALLMLLPSIVSIAVLTWLERYNIRYQKISTIEIRKNRTRDGVFGVISGAVCAAVLMVFAVIVIVPFVKLWPYEMSFTMEHVIAGLTGSELGSVYKNSLFVAIVTAICGVVLTYGAALITARSKLSKGMKKIIESISLITNTVPGMVLGIAYLLMFTGTSLQNTFLILIICNVIHYFSTPYLMFHNSLAKMNQSWETTAMLMGDSWIKTIIRVVTPNAMSTVWEVFAYYFVNAMVTISAVVFLVGARTAVMTTKIKELQHFAKFNEIFILSLMILLTNAAAKIVFEKLANRRSKKK